MKFIGEKLRILRKARGKSMKDIEIMTGIKQGMLSQIENEIKNPRDSTVNKLANALGVSVEYFYLDLDRGRISIELLPEMDEATKEFVMNAKNMPYIILGKEAAEKGIPLDVLKDMMDVLAKFNRRKND